MFLRQEDKVAVGHLPVPDNASGGHIEIRGIIRPEVVSSKGVNRFQQQFRRIRRGSLARTKMEANQRALSNRTCRKPVAPAKPCCGALVQTVSGVASAIRTLESSR